MPIVLYDGLGIEVTGIAEVLYTEFLFFQDSIIVGFGGQSVTVSDTLSLSDTATAQPGITVSPSDTLSLSDAEANVFFVSFLVGDKITLSDGVGYGFGISDTLFFFDSVKYKLTAGDFNSRAVFDSLNFIDKAILAAPYITGLGDTLNLSDSTFANYLTPSLDTISLTDAAVVSLVNLILATNFSVGDSFNTFDGITFGTQGLNLFGDRVRLADAAAVVFGSSTDSYLRRYLNDVV